jgi:hypothetical protein
MNESHTDTVQFDVNLPKPKPRSLILKVLAGLVVLGVVAFAVFAIVNRTASPTADATAQVMPATTQLFFSMTTHADKQPNFDAVANAWKNSKEAKQIDAALSLALTSAGYSWDNDVVPWLGDRAAIGLVDLGAPPQPGTPDKPYDPTTARSPIVIFAVQTKDKAKSDAFLANARKQIEASLKPSDYYTTTVADDSYRGISIVYMTTEYNFGSSTSTKNEMLAVATVNDAIVLSTSRDNVKQAIDAALNGANLAANEGFKQTMAALPQPNVAAMYMDLSRFFTGYMNMIMGVTESFTYDSLTLPGATPDPNIAKQREDARSKQQAQLKQMTDLMQAYGGVGMAMTYEPAGIRFDTVEQYDQSRLPEQWRSLFAAMMGKSVSGKMFEAMPASALMALNGPADSLKIVLDPSYWSMMFAANPALQGVDFASKLAEFQKLTGVDLKTDVVDLISGEYGFMLGLKDPSQITRAMPVDLAFMLDSTDAARLAGNVDKIAQALATLSNGQVKWQSLSGLPYSVLTDKSGNVMLTYGVVNGRFVIGSTSETLQSIASADKTSLANDATFKDALTGLPTNRAQLFYFQFKPLWDMLQQASSTDRSISGVLNYLRPFKYVSVASETPGSTMMHGVMRIGLEAAK